MAEEVRIGFGLSIDRPWITSANSAVRPVSMPGRVSQAHIASFWSEAEGRVLVFLAIVPRPNTYFSEDSKTLAEQIGEWEFFDDKKITDQKGLGCAFGICLGFRADDLACAVFRRQIGSAGKPRIEYRDESAGPRIYGFYCRAGVASLSSSDADEVMQAIKEN
jgi:hypothetical protein